jgi:hypothetical protein
LSLHPGRDSCQPRRVRAILSQAESSAARGSGPADRPRG